MDLFAKLSHQASDIVTSLAQAPAKLAKHLPSIPTPSFLHGKKALETLKVDLQTSGAIAICPLALAIMTTKSIVNLSLQRQSIRRNFALCEKMVKALPKDSPKANKVGETYATVFESIKKGGKIDELDKLNTAFKDNCTDTIAVEKFKKTVSKIKKNTKSIDDEKAKTKDKIDNFRDILIGVLSLPALPLTLGIGALGSVFAVVDSLFTLATGNRIDLPRHKPSKRNNNNSPLDL